MFALIKARFTRVVLATFFSFFAASAQADTELTMYYPVAVGGPLTQVVDGIVADFMNKHAILCTTRNG